MTITIAEIQELRRLSKEATERPWRRRQALQPTDGAYDEAIGATFPDGKEYCIAEVFGRVSEGIYPNAQGTAYFIALLANKADALLDLAEKALASEGALTLPATMTKAIEEVLGIPNFVAGPIAHRMNRLGFNIEGSSEKEQAAVLWWLLPFAIKHGEEWRREGDLAFKKLEVDHGRAALSDSAGKGEGK